MSGNINFRKARIQVSELNNETKKKKTELQNSSHAET
jgi:hypothetical protein